MNALLLDDSGTILSIIVVNSLNDLPNLADASLGGKVGDRIVNGALVPAPQVLEVPEEISPRQFLQSLNHFGFRQQVDGAIAASTDQDLKDWYARTSVFQRHHPEVLAMAAALGFTDAQVDQVWIYGSTLL